MGSRKRNARRQCKAWDPIMNPHSLKIQHALGLDVSADTITLHDSRSQSTVVVANQFEALRQALQPFAGQPDLLAVCEATGGYEDCLLAVLDPLAIATHRADALKVKGFIRSYGTRAKTDAIDARWLSIYGIERAANLARWAPKDERQQRLCRLVARHDDLVAMRVQEKNRLKAPRNRLVAADIQDHVDDLDRRIDAILAEIEALVASDPGLDKRRQALCSVPGIGDKIAFGFLAHLSELGSLNRRQAASLAGCAPHPRDSGNLNRHRTTTAGRRSFLPKLFLAAMAAIRGKNPLADAYNAFLKAGKPKRVALVAIMRKIVTIANARLRDLMQTAKI